jgi:hypothetical protein
MGGGRGCAAKLEGESGRLGGMLRRLAHPLALVSPLVSFFASPLLSGCSDSSTPSTDGSEKQGPPVVVTNDRESKQTGKIIRAQTEDEAIDGATITIAGKTATTNAAGGYEIIVPRNTPYQMTVAANGYYKLLEQEWILKTETLDRGATNLLLGATANFLAGLLPGRKADKGLVVVKVNPQPPCASEEGATLTIDPPGEAKIAYFAGSLPDTQQTSVKAGSAFSAAFYNVEVGVPVKITVSSPSCAQVPFPVDVGDVTYTGFQKAEAGEALSYIRVYIKDPVATDAGTD